ncbi:PRC-barrel domain containing protein [Halomonas sp. HK25]|uniref:PRC-barrel domain containing protein n=1 Tax=Halomonas sp. HK25 TaxID=3394321 RepID=UPI0039FD7BE2
MKYQGVAKASLTTGAALLAASLTAYAQAQYEPQGLYSVMSILDAEVYFEAAPDSEAGDVRDILLGEDRQVHSLVVRPHNSLGIGDDAIVIGNDSYHLLSYEDDDGKITHDVIVEIHEEAFEELPRYDQDWWDLARERAREAWETTQEGAERAGRAIGEAIDDLSN